MIVFKSKPIPTASHSTLVAQAPGVYVREHEFFGLTGVSEIVGGRGPREIECEVWLSDKSWTGNQPSSLYKELSRLDKLVGRHGLLREETSGGLGLKRQFPDCTFLGFTPTPIDGQEEPGPLRDDGGTLHNYSNFTSSGGAWFIFGRLRWRQTTPKSI